MRQISVLTNFMKLGGIVTQLRPERLLNHQDGLKRLHINLREEPLEPPANTLPGHAKGLVDLLAVGALENHIARPTRLQLDP